MLNLSRLYFFFPVVFYVMLFYILTVLWQGKKVLKTVVVSLILLQIISNTTTAMWIRRGDKPTYRQYVSKEVFDRAEKIVGMGRDEFKIACFGFYQAIAHLNKFSTVGGYNSLYPLDYKHRFRKIISAELEKSEILRNYFDKQSSRCYLASSEAGKNFYLTGKTGPKSISNLQIDTQALKDIGALYIFSSVVIENAVDINLEYAGKAEDKDAAIDLHIYRIVAE